VNSLERLFDKLDVTKRGYVVNKVLTRGFFVVFGLFTLLIGFTYGFSFQWVECPVDSVDGFCLNPYYDEYCFVGDLCEEPVIVAGSVIGVKPPRVVELFPSFTFGAFLAVLLLNHFRYNKGYFWKKRMGLL